MVKKQDNLSGPIIGLVVAQGVIGILFGLAALFWPETTVRVFAVLFGAFAAHGLKHTLSSEHLAVLKTAVDYQFIHALALLLVAVLAEIVFKA